ncbi:uncharacterized protein [Drosophila virilis]|uniref:Uncharacterized protein n=1 Tax=Drosophila virilis TaxID=7244 RepID=B4LGM3_DROVI|nr:uncharacterized protein LOC6622072 [Drosophila virilis]EDW69461.2 uncharacterized protein Dvir_GJ12104 [Drosophila virilis]
MDPNKPIKTDEDDSSKNKPDCIVTKHAKRAVLEYLKQHGCTRANLETSAWARRNNQENVIDYICRAYKDAETRVNQECDSVSLSHINQWLQLLKSAELSTLCEYEAAAVVNALVLNEAQPEPAQLGGVNMGEVYGFVENALTGHPQKKLSAASEAFLSREIELLIDEANNDHSDNVARRMGQSLFDRQEYNYEAEPHKCSLDPLFLDE